MSIHPRLALEEIALPIRQDNDAIRVTVMGDTGNGKSFILEKITRYLVAESLVGTAFVLDDKRMDPQYAGHYRIDVADMHAKPPMGPPPVTVFRGTKLAGGRPIDHEAVARLAMDLCVKRAITSVVVVDEFGRLISSPQQWERPDSKWREVFREGRSLIPRSQRRAGLACGVSVLYSSLSPQDPPRDAIEQTDRIVLCGIAGLGLRHLQRVHSLPDELVGAVGNFKRGEFAVHRRGVSRWDGRIYGPSWA